MTEPLKIELAYFNTLMERQTRWEDIRHLKETLLRAILPDVHGSIVDAVYSLPEFPQMKVCVKADRDNNEVKVTFEHTGNGMMPMMPGYRQDEVRVEVLRNTIELLNKT